LKPVADVVEFARPLRNIPGVEIMSADEVEVYHLLKHRWVVMEGDAIDAIQAHKGQAQPVELLEKPTPGRRIVRPGRWLVHSWRKQRGSKSMRKTFGTKNATAREVAAKRMWKRLRRLGMDQTPDNVNVLLNMRKASVAA
jgi:large subunit ribosomal protein L4